MPRNYSEQFLIKLHKLDDSRTGVKLAKACVSANLPAMYVASALGVTRMTIYSWFRGKPLRDKNVQRVNTFITRINTDTEAGLLPAPTMKSAKEYIERTLGSVTPTTDVS
jgi:hypothetical protein